LDAAALWSRTLTPGAPQQAVYIDGVANLVGVSLLSDDRTRLRAMLSALEEKQRLIELLNAYVDARQESVRVIFDLEQQDPGMAGLVLIAAPARVSPSSAGSQDSQDTPGTIAILGPRRMNYQSAIEAVGYVARILHRTTTGEFTGDLAPPSP
jgi:heat-inducible transcriptional repressor